MSEQNLVRMLLTSSLAEDCDEADLLQLARSSVYKNPMRGITGILLAQEVLFLYIIEAPFPKAVQFLNEITFDYRSTEVKILSKTRVLHRMMLDWRMGVVDASPSLLQMPSVFNLSKREMSNQMHNCRFLDLHTFPTIMTFAALSSSFYGTPKTA